MYHLYSDNAFLNRKTLPFCFLMFLSKNQDNDNNLSQTAECECEGKGFGIRHTGGT